MSEHEGVALTRRGVLAGCIAGVGSTVLTSGLARAAAPASKRPAVDPNQLERTRVELVAPPQVHAHSHRAPGKPRIVEFRMVIEEKELAVDNEAPTSMP
jgi:nitrite reductase (NO-forming)